MTFGYNYQTGAIVWGIEGDINYSAVRASTACGVFTCETSNRWFSTVRGRVGYAVDRFLPYITAGAAYGDIRAASTNPLFPGATKTKLGWTAGAGLEYAFMGNWTAKLEYLYLDLGRFDCGTACSATVVPDNVSFREHIVRVGLNYKFGGPLFSRF